MSLEIPKQIRDSYQRGERHIVVDRETLEAYAVCLRENYRETPLPLDNYTLSRITSIPYKDALVELAPDSASTR